ncbi:hypothetical protein KM043_001268 [Ampulex compressa]|nr:hypothetical protein KM043_001268 [Ampulex compressa]
MAFAVPPTATIPSRLIASNAIPPFCAQAFQRHRGLEEDEDEGVGVEIALFERANPRSTFQRSCSRCASFGSTVIAGAHRSPGPSWGNTVDLGEPGLWCGERSMLGVD